MANASFVQSDFRGGIWSRTAQGRITDPAFKTGLNVSHNAVYLEQGAWTRRPGFRRIGLTRYGQKSRLLPFRFSREQAYQAVFSDLKLRFVSGLSIILDATNIPDVLSITADTPAKVYVESVGLWEAGDTVMFNINTDQAPSTYALFGRQFRIGSVNITENSFTLLDPFTGASIDGSTIDFIPRPLADTVQRVLELDSPYVEADLPNIRVVQSTDKVLFLCPGIPPWLLTVSGATQFSFAEADFEDGPYFDENTTETTLALSAKTGSVTVTASSVVGINDGLGFQSTDVGRQIWWQGGPAEWDGATTYSKNQKVLGSDGNIYKSLKGNNLNHNPTTDSGSFWEITSSSVQVTWLIITAVTDTTHVTATVQRDNLQNKAATTHWRLGVYSDTTGYPTCGTYHEARLALGGAVPNRFDMSMSFNELKFSPTQGDASIADDNALSGTFENRDAEEISWMRSTEDGMAIGTLAGEWIVRASALDDALSPTVLQGRQRTTAGSANIESVNTLDGAPVFVQAAKRKVMSLRGVGGNKYEAVNLSKNAEGLGAPEIEELAWVQEPLLSLFARRSDGILVGCTHRISQLDESFNGWHDHSHGYDRSFEALSYGPGFDGTSDVLYVVTADRDAPDDNPRWIETMMPVASSGDATWVAWHTDGSTTAGYIRRMILANGDSFDGLRIYGLHDLNGFTVHPFIGGLDLGNFVVANGFIDLPYSGSFTAAFLDGISDGTNYASWGQTLRWFDAPITDLPEHPANTIAAIDNDGGTVTPSGGRLIIDLDLEVAYRIRQTGGGLNNIRKFDALNGDLLVEVPDKDTIFNEVATTKLLYVNGNEGVVWTLVKPDADLPDGGMFIKSAGGLAGASIISLINGTDCIVDANATGFSNPEFVMNVPHFQADILGNPVYNQLAFIKQQSNVDEYNHVSVVNLTNNGPLKVLTGGSAGLTLDRFQAGDSTNNSPMFTMDRGDHNIWSWGCRGFEEDGLSVWFTMEANGSALALATSFRIRKWMISSSATTWEISNEIIYTFAPSDFLAGWTAVDALGIMFDGNDRTLLVSGVKRIDGDPRIFKFDPWAREQVWNVAYPTAQAGAGTFCAASTGAGAGPWMRKRWAYIDTDSVVHTLNLTDGTWTSISAITTGFQNIGTMTDIIELSHVYDDEGPSIIFAAKFDAGVDTPTYIGDWATAHAPTWTADPQFNRLWLGLDYEQDQDHRELNADYWVVPANIGVSFTSDGQLLRPDYGVDAGAQNGPGFGKLKRNHWWAADFYRAMNVKVGIDFDKMYPVKFASAGGTPVAHPNLFSGIASDTINGGHTFDAQIAWRVERQYSCTITAMGGYIQSTDK